VDWLLNSQHTQNLQLNGSQIVEQVVQLDVFPGGLHALINGDNQLVRLLDGQCPLGVDDRLHSHLDELLLKDIQVLEVVFLIDEVVFERSNGAFHVQYSCLFPLEPHGTDGHEVTHDCLCSDYSKLIVSFLFALQLHSHHFLAPLNQFEILLLGELKTCDLVMQNTDVFQQVFM
jgi:hypothetical protein